MLIFDNALKHEDDNHFSDPQQLETLHLGQLQCKHLDGNPIFQLLRGKLVSFYEGWERHQLENDHSAFNLDDPPTKEQLDALCLKKTLTDSLKRLLRVVISTEDPDMQGRHLTKLYHWFRAKETV